MRLGVVEEAFDRFVFPGPFERGLVQRLRRRLESLPRPHVLTSVVGSLPTLTSPVRSRRALIPLPLTDQYPYATAKMNSTMNARKMKLPPAKSTTRPPLCSGRTHRAGGAV